ncbi:MAG: hypothetical protein PUB48_03960, partial [Solobacterium sp.]|nr:hypothetical protein [Solobacterium sp.]
MKKAITTILSVLMLLSCLTVNVFANETNIENQDPETNGELNVQEEVSDDENEISLDGSLVSPLNEEGDSIQ